MIDPIEPNYDNQLQEKALALAALTETLESIISNMTEFIKVLPAEHREEAKVYLGQIKAIYSTLGDADSEVAELVNITNQVRNLNSSKIKRLGIASDLIRLRKDQGLTYKELATRFSITEKTISNFFKVYDKAPPTEKNNLKRSDVYNINHNMQVLHAGLLRQMARFETEGEVSARFMSEYRQLIALADKQRKEYTTAQKFDRMAMLVQEVLLQHCSSEGRQSVIEEFRKLGVSGLISPAAEPRTINQT